VNIIAVVTALLTASKKQSNGAKGLDEQEKQPQRQPNLRLRNGVVPSLRAAAPTEEKVDDVDDVAEVVPAVETDVRRPLTTHMTPRAILQQRLLMYDRNKILIPIISFSAIQVYIVYTEYGSFVNPYICHVNL
jgi:hypothetical protein